MENEKTASMDDILSGETTEEIVVEDAPGEKEESVKETSVEAETPSEESIKKEESPPDSETQIPLSAYTEQRSKRQAVEKERDDLRAELDKSTQTPPTSVFEDESKFRSEISAQIDQGMSNVILNQSEFFARREFGSEHLDKQIEIFKELVKDNEPLRLRFINATSPYHELDDIVKQHDELKQMEDMDGYRAKIRAEERVKAEKDIQDEATGKKALRDSVPDSLVDEPSKGGLDSKTAEPLAAAEDIYNL